VRLPDAVRARRARLLVSDKSVNLGSEGRWARFELGSITDHEVAVIE
jgi:hypothetical protein